LPTADRLHDIETSARPSRRQRQWLNGQKVHKGEELARLAKPELEAALVLAKAGLSTAQAARGRVYAGVRIEQVNALERQIEVAKQSGNFYVTTPQLL
jgi:multidrug efflux pump subunit AcrA (membrane-fusion protein)